jgi:hypothetical protein
MLKTIASICLALVACADVDDVTSDLPIVPVDFGQVWDCDMTVQLGHPTAVSEIHDLSHPCLIDGDDANRYQQAWVDDVCNPTLDRTPDLAKIGGGGCYGGCQLKDDGLDLCTTTTN